MSRAPADTGFEGALRVADAVLYEGYLLYPYRSSAQKNQMRWQFGVVAPRAWSEAGGGDSWRTRTETLVEAGDGAAIRVRMRGLQLETLDRDGPSPWDEGTEQQVDATISLSGALAAGQVVPFVLPGQEGPAGRRRSEVCGLIRVSAARLDGPYGVIRLRVDVENTTDWDGGGTGRQEALRRSLVGTHLLLAVTSGRFLSLADPPEWARPAAEGCVNEGMWPVLMDGDGEGTVILSSPIILPDRAEVAPESAGDLFDATEIDEILGLRILALTDDEKAEARLTDPRAAAIVDRLETLPAEMWQRLHGAVRSLRPAGPAPATDVPWWDPGADASVSPETDSIPIHGVAVSRGAVVRLRPGRGADAQDMFLDGRLATVEAVLSDVDGGHHLAVTLQDDPAAELLQTHGRFLYFRPEEVEPA